MPVTGNIFLVGPMGAGKTAIGRVLADALGRDFHDTDQEINARTGVEVGFVFDKEGEDGFRRRECEVLDALTRLEGIVLATGGGAVLDSVNREHLKSRGTVIHLHTGVDTQLERIRASGNRPLMETADPRARLEALAVIRNPLYREIADLTVETDGLHIRKVARNILARLEDSGWKR